MNLEIPRSTTAMSSALKSRGDVAVYQQILALRESNLQDFIQIQQLFFDTRYGIANGSIKEADVIDFVAARAALGR